jgi:hypothetical protein
MRRPLAFPDRPRWPFAFGPPPMIPPPPPHLPEWVEVSPETLARVRDYLRRHVPAHRLYEIAGRLYVDWECVAIEPGMALSGPRGRVRIF